MTPADAAPPRDGAPHAAAPRVLVPRSGNPDEPFADAVRAAGMEPVVVPLITIEPPHDVEPLHRAVHDLGSGTYDWLVLTSTRSLDALLAAGLDPGSDADLPRVAAVGPGTARRARRAGLTVTLVPKTEHSARGLLAALTSLPAPHGTAESDPHVTPDPPRVLVPHSGLSRPLLVVGLRKAGWDVTDVVAYRTVLTSRLPQDAGDLAAVVLTSSSTATAWARASRRAVVGRTDPVIVCLGAPTAETAGAEGLTVSRVASTPTPEAVVAALVTALGAAL